MLTTKTQHSHPQPTLLPYLRTGKSGIHIEFLPSANAPIKKESTFPFKTLDKPDPLARRVKACFSTDADSKILDLLVWLQRDRPHSTKDLSEATNPAIEQLWHQAFDRLSQSKTFNESLFKLSEQKAGDGHLVSFQSLFYCTLKKQFFPPPCPLCGGLLDLCRGDDMLTASGLDTYTCSLKRYLFCPTCYQLAGETDFYTYRSPNEEPDTVKTATELILNFKNLVVSNMPAQQFPCRTCPEASNCHASGGLVGDRIVPFAFYPFHMLIFKTDSAYIDDLTLCATAKGELAPYSKVVREKHKQPPPDESIQLILKRLVTKWRLEASKTSEMSGITDTSPQMKPPDPTFVAPASSSALDVNPDLKETIIVRNDSGPNSKYPRAHGSASRATSIPTEVPGDIQINQKIPETIIVTAKSLTKGTIWPNTNGSEKYRSNLPASDKLKQKHPPEEKSEPLPETIMVRPGKDNNPQPGKPITAQPIQSTRPEKTLDEPDDSLGNPFTFNKADQRHTKDPQDESNSHKKFIKTFKLGHEQNSTPLMDEPMRPPLTDSKSAPFEADQQLAKTIIVKPKSDKKEE